MATWMGFDHSDRVLKAAAVWREKCLEADGSVFTSDALWTRQNLTVLKETFDNNFIEGSQTFYEKLEIQLGGSGPEIQKLAAEVIWSLLLFGYERTFGVDRKLERIGEVWAFSGEELPQSPLLDADAMRGIANLGTAYLTNFWREFSYALSVFIGLKSEPNQSPSEILGSGPWKLCEWLAQFEGSEARGFRHVFLYFMYPEDFERILSKGHKARIYDVFKHYIPPGEDAYEAAKNPCNLDRSIYVIRQALEAEYGTSEVDFYRGDLMGRWQDQSENAQKNANRPARQFWIEKTINHNRPDRLSGEHAMGEALWSPQRSKNGADIYSSMRAVRPGDIVFHLIDNKMIAGVSVVESAADDTFVGLPNTEWGGQPGYRIQLKDYQELDPPLSREAIFNGAEEVQSALRELAADPEHRGLFFNRNLELNQGKYLTPAPDKLLAALNTAYQHENDQSLPYLDWIQPLEPTVIEGEGYSLEDALEDLFIAGETAKRIMRAWQRKKNVVLQGPPGVGKTFAAKRLAYALMGEKTDARIELVQFHQSYSYEEFVQGYRPTSDGGFALRSGRFFEFCEQARQDPSKRHVFIIDEINRGNLSKIFGELLMLVEGDKRGEQWAVQLAYAADAPPFFVPENVFILGLMNTADRSLAVVDYALRRRFAFFDLEPRLGSPRFRQELANIGIGADVAERIVERISRLNDAIGKDTANLGPGFRIGHSFFCAAKLEGQADNDWYAEIIGSEIMPLLEEYWFDDPDKVSAWREELLLGVQ